MNVEIDILSFTVGVVVGWVFKVAASNISLPSFGVEHADDSTIAVVAASLQDTRKKVRSELDEMIKLVSNYKAANDDGGLTKDEVGELCSIFYASNDKLRKI